MKRKSLLAFLLLSIAAALSASTITIDDAIALAKENNKSLQVARINLENSIRSASVISYLPSLSVGSKFTMSASAIDETYSMGLSPTVAAKASMTIDTSDIYDSKVNAMTRQSAINTYDQSVSSTENSVRTAYWNLVSANLAVESAKKNLEDSERSYRNVQEQYEGGKASTLALSQAELSLYDSELAYDNAVTTVDNAKLTLGYLIGKQDFDVEKSLPEVGELKSYDEVKEMVTSSLSYQQAVINLSQAELTSKALKATTLYPTVSVSASYEIGHQITGPYDNSRGKSSSWDGELYDSAALSVGVNLPLDHLLPSSKAKANLQNASANITKAELLLQSTLDSLEQSVEKAYRSVETAEKNIAKYEKHLEMAKSKLSLTEAAYEGGRATYDALSNAQSDLFESEISLLNQHLTWVTALSSLATTLGVDSASLLK